MIAIIIGFIWLGLAISIMFFSYDLKIIFWSCTIIANVWFATAHVVGN